jgi:predicted nuclease of predicted toxin-antitoxin system
MVRLLGDENFNDNILQGVLDHSSAIVFLRVRAAGLESKTDDVVLEWAAENGYVVVSHDANTMIHEANKRIQAGLSCPGLLIIKVQMPYREAIDELVMAAICGDPADFRDLVIHLPF